MSYLCGLCLFEYGACCVVFLFCFASSCEICVASFSGLSLLLLPLR